MSENKPLYRVAVTDNATNKEFFSHSTFSVQDSYLIYQDVKTRYGKENVTLRLFRNDVEIIKRVCPIKE